MNKDIQELPENHGRLIDADALLVIANKQVEEIRQSQDWPKLYGAILIRDMINAAPVLVDADN